MPLTDLLPLSQSFEKKHSLPQDSMQAAGSRIYHVYRNYRGQQRPDNVAVPISERKTIIELMKKLSALIKYSDTAAAVNGVFDACMHRISSVSRHTTTHQDNPAEDTVDYLYSKRQRALACIDRGSGNCGELTDLLIVLILSDPDISSATKALVKPCCFERPDDHSFVVIGELSDPNALVVDQWLNHLNLPVVVGHRKFPSAGNQRVRGYIGSQQDYLDYINSYADGRFVRPLGVARARNICIHSCQIDAHTADYISRYIRLPYYKSADGSTYRGQVNRDLLPDGPGRITYPGGHIVEGIWDNGCIQGEAIITRLWGHKVIFYRGEVDECYAPTGYGVMYQRHRRSHDEPHPPWVKYRGRWIDGKQVAALSREEYQQMYPTYANPRVMFSRNLMQQDVCADRLYTAIAGGDTQRAARELSYYENLGKPFLLDKITNRHGQRMRSAFMHLEGDQLAQMWHVFAAYSSKSRAKASPRA